jgi:hypothetical protein
MEQRVVMRFLTLKGLYASAIADRCKHCTNVCCKRSEKSTFYRESRFSLDVLQIPSVFSELLNENQSRNILKYAGKCMDPLIFEFYIMPFNDLSVIFRAPIRSWPVHSNLSRFFDCFVQCLDHSRSIFQYCASDTNYRWLGNSIYSELSRPAVRCSLHFLANILFIWSWSLPMSEEFRPGEISSSWSEKRTSIQITLWWIEWTRCDDSRNISRIIKQKLIFAEQQAQSHVRKKIWKG